jgi:excinuclease UvrABC helicase subunit UvrB
MFRLKSLFSVLPVFSMNFDELFKEYEKAEDDLLKDAKLIDTYRYTVSDMLYEQKVYRLSNNEIYVTTQSVDSENLKVLELKLKKAVEKQDFELAAKLRDKIYGIKTKKSS